MSAVTVIANLPCLGLRKDQEVTVELTDLIQGALDGGKLSLVEPPALPSPALDPAPVDVEKPKAKEGRARGERDDHDAPGGDS